MRNLLVVLALIVQGAPALSCEPCHLTRVVDGDTLVLRCGESTTRVRMKYIDAPELKQPYGTDAKSHLWVMLEGVDLTVCGDKKDLYGRTLAEVFTPDSPNQSVNLKMVQDGFAWSYKHQRKEYNNAESAARKERRGLWQDDIQESPWDFRRRVKQHTADYPLDGICDPVDRRDYSNA